MNTSLKTFFIISSILVFSQRGYASLLEQLSPEELNDINHGAQVVHREEVQGAVWPEVVVFQKIDALPEEVMAVFHDYSLHKDIFPGIVKSARSKQISPNTADIDYTMTFPPMLGFQMKDENYTTRNIVEAFEGYSTYKMSWTKVRTESIKDIKGWILVEPYEQGSLVAYDNFISPPRPSIAKLVVKMFIERVQETLANLGTQVNKERKENIVLLQQQIDALKVALGR